MNPPKQAMIFAAGLGTRLKPLTDTMPKALVEIGGKPLLYHVICRLQHAGFTSLVVNVHHFAQQIIDYLQAHENFGLDIQVSHESGQLLETGGGIRKAWQLFDPHAPVLIHNVDILSNVDLSYIYNKVYGHDALLLVSSRQTSRYLLFDDENRLQGWTNIQTGEVKGPAAASESLSASSDGMTDKLNRYAFSGIHVLSPQLLNRMATYPDRFPIMDFYLRECATADIHAEVNTGLKMIDVGKLDSLARAEEFIREHTV